MVPLPVENCDVRSNELDFFSGGRTFIPLPGAVLSFTAGVFCGQSLSLLVPMTLLARYSCTIMSYFCVLDAVFYDTFLLSMTIYYVFIEDFF